MIEILLQLDTKLFTFINHLPHNSFLDFFFAFLTGIGYGGIVWFLIGIAIFVWEEVKDRKTLFALVLAGLFSLLLNEWGIKNIIRRPRPQFTISEVVVPFDVASSFSFPSGHATIAFAAAFIFSRKHKKLAWIFYLLASLIAFSRIYLGKHYPSDVVVGGLIGTLIGYFCLKITDWKWRRKKYGQT